MPYPNLQQCTGSPTHHFRLLQGYGCNTYKKLTFPSKKYISYEVLMDQFWGDHGCLGKNPIHCYCFGPMKYESSVIPVKATGGSAEPGIQCWRGFTFWTPAPQGHFLRGIEGYVVLQLRFLGSIDTGECRPIPKQRSVGRRIGVTNALNEILGRTAWRITEQTDRNDGQETDGNAPDAGGC